MNIDEIIIDRKLSIVFMGTPQFAASILEDLYQKYDIKAVVTQIDKKKKNGKIVYSPVKEFALKNEILLLQYQNIKDNSQEILQLNADIIITAAYGQILPKELLYGSKYQSINVHASLLPKYRGAAPIQRVIMRAEKETGVSIMYMDSGLDTGDIILQKKINIHEEDTGSSLTDKLTKLAIPSLNQALELIVNDKAKAIKQKDEDSSYAKILTKVDEKLDFSNSKYVLYNQVRAMAEEPATYCSFNNKIIKVYAIRISENNFGHLLDGQVSAIYKDGIGIKVANGEIVLLSIKPEGKNKMNAKAFINGLREDIKGRFFH